jgi:hypothetical protein
MPYHQRGSKKRGGHYNAQGGNGHEVAARKSEDSKSAEALITPENYAKRWPILANECVEEYGTAGIVAEKGIPYKHNPINMDDFEIEPPQLLAKAKKSEDQDRIDQENERIKAAHRTTERMMDIKMTDAIRSRNKIVAQLEEQQFKVFAHIWKKLSIQSRELVKLEDSTIYENKSAEDLVLAIIKTHKLGSTIHNNPDHDQRVTRQNYMNTIQRTEEGLVSYYERLNDNKTRMVETGNDMPSDSDQVQDFLAGLHNSVFGEWRTQYHIGVAELTRKKYANVEEAYQGVSSYVQTMIKTGVLKNMPGSGARGNTYTAFTINSIGAPVRQQSNDQPSRGKEPAGRGNRGRGRGCRGGRGNGGRGRDNNGDNRNNNTNMNETGETDKPSREELYKKNACFNCGKVGHRAAACPAKEDDPQQLHINYDNETAFHVCSEVAMPNTTVNLFTIIENKSDISAAERKAFAIAKKTTEPYEVLLDTQSNVSAVHPMLLHSIEALEEPIILRVGGEKISINDKGLLEGFGWVYSSKELPANILCETDVAELYPRIDYIPGKLMRVHLQGRVLTFHNRNKFYVADMSDWINEAAKTHVEAYITTVQEMEATLSKAEMARLEIARKFIANAGFPSEMEAIRLLHDGNIAGNFGITGVDIKTAFRIPDNPHSIRGKLKNKKVSRQEVDDTLINVSRKQELQTDVMFVLGRAFLVTHADPLKLGMLFALPEGPKGLDEYNVSRALHNQLQLLRSYRVHVSRVLVEPTTTAACLVGKMGEVPVELVGTGEKVTRCDRMMLSIQEIIRSVHSSLPYELPYRWVIPLATYATIRKNSRRSTAKLNNVAPKVELTGRTLHKRDMEHGMGDYVEAYVGTSNTPKDRSHWCILMYPLHNSSGSWYMFDLQTKSFIRRSNFKKLPITQQVIDEVNRYAVSCRPKGKPLVPGHVTYPIALKKPVDFVRFDEMQDKGDPPAPEEQHEQVTEEENMPKVNTDEQKYMVEQATIPSTSGSTSDSNLVISKTTTAKEENSIDNAQVVEDAKAEVAEEDAVSDSSDDESSSSDDDSSSDNSTSTSDDDQDMELKNNSTSDNDQDIELKNTSTSDNDQDIELKQEEVTVRRSSRSNKGQTAHRPGFVYESRRSLPGTREMFKARIVGGHRKGAVHKGTDYNAYHISARRSVEVIGKKAVEAIINELDGLIDKKKCIHPVQRNQLSKTQRKKIIRSHMLMKEKMKMGILDKVKARLVGDGSMQDRDLYPDRYSPTVSLPAVTTVLAIAAKENRHIAALDVGKAYTNADMTGEEVYIEVDSFVTAYILKHKPDLKPFLEESGKMVFKLDKALYGCIQSARLWYDTIKAALIKMGFTQNEQDECVFNRMNEGVQLTLALYVDDLLCTCKDIQFIKNFEKELISEYGEVSADYGDKSGRVAYLGMTIQRRKAGVHVSMDDYLADMLAFCPIDAGTRFASTPAAENLFTVDENSPSLSKKEHEMFHSTVAKALYLTLRTRPDIATTVSFLTTRVSCPTKQDWNKLMRMMSYLQHNPHKGLLFPTKGGMEIDAYIDAAFCAHMDGKSHTGVIVRIGGALVYVKSTKQKIISRDSTEAETIGLSDHTDKVLWFHLFMKYQGYDPQPPIIYQDNKSTISLVTKGGGKPRTRHLRARQYAVKEQVDAGDYKIEYMITEVMIADVLTKPLQSAKYELFVDSMTLDF